jgi:hypothetical protein
MKILNTSHDPYRYVSLLEAMSALKSELCIRLVAPITLTEQENNEWEFKILV